MREVTRLSIFADGERRSRTDGGDRSLKLKEKKKSVSEGETCVCVSEEDGERLIWIGN